MALDDLMLYDFEHNYWSAICQYGVKPSGRWGAAMTYTEDTEQLYIFGGGSNLGVCGNAIYCCEFNDKKIKELKEEYWLAYNEAQRQSKRTKFFSIVEPEL